MLWFPLVLHPLAQLSSQVIKRPIATKPIWKVPEMNKLMAITLIHILILSGCSSGRYKEYQSITSFEMDLLDRFKTCGQNDKLGCARREELVACCGLPELEMQMSNLPVLLAGDRGFQMNDPYVEYIMQNEYFAYKAGYIKSNNVNDTDWRNCEEFLNLTLWFYQFNDGPVLYASGIIPHKSGEFYPYCFIIHGDYVIGKAIVPRPLSKRK